MFKSRTGPDQVAQLISVVWICQGHGFDLWSGHIQEATTDCINKWNNKLMSLSPLSPLPLSLSLKLKKNTLKVE